MTNAIFSRRSRRRAANRTPRAPAAGRAGTAPCPSQTGGGSMERAKNTPRPPAPRPPARSCWLTSGRSASRRTQQDAAGHSPACPPILAWPALSPRIALPTRFSARSFPLPLRRRHALCVSPRPLSVAAAAAAPCLPTRFVSPPPACRARLAPAVRSVICPPAATPAPYLRGRGGQ